VEGIVTEKGKIAVEARLFSELVRKLPDNEILLESDRNYKIRLSCEDSVFYLNANNPDEFPDLPKTVVMGEISISEFTFKEMIRQTIFSIAANDANALMKGELMAVSGDTVKMIALDSHRIAIRREKLSNIYDDSEVIVPGKTLNEISRILAGNVEDIINIEFDNRFIKFILKKTIVISRLIEGQFFNVEQMISSDYSTRIKVNKMDFMNNIDRALTLIREGDRKPVVMEIRDGFMNMDITSSIGSMNAKIPVIREGSDLVIGFNPRYIMDAIRVIDDEEVSIYFMNSNSPCFIRNDQSEYVYIILPVNISR